MPDRSRRRASGAIWQQAVAFRRRMTSAERVLWEQLRRKQLHGFKFRRQHPVGPFIVDFYCARQRLIVEVDGEVHIRQRGSDQVRTRQLEAYGYRVLRFRNDEILGDLAEVLRRISRACGVR